MLDHPIFNSVPLAAYTGEYSFRENDRTTHTLARVCIEGHLLVLSIIANEIMKDTEVLTLSIHIFADNSYMH